MSTKMSVRAHRTSRDWSVRRLAAESGVSTPTIERIEAVEVGTKQHYDPRLSQVVKLADAFGVCIDALIPERAHASNLPDAHGRPPHGTSEKTTARDATSPTPTSRADRSGA